MISGDRVAGKLGICRGEIGQELGGSGAVRTDYQDDVLMVL